MFNLNQYIADTPSRFQQLTYNDSLLTIYNCRIEGKFADIWSHNNYIIYVAEGRKIWHTAQGSFDLRAGSCVFVRRGGAIVEQFFDSEFCFYLFFVSDEFICDVLNTKSKALHTAKKDYGPVIPIESSDVAHSFFKSMLPYFNAPQPPDQSLLQLKFKELILLLAENKSNEALLHFFCNLLHAPKNVSLRSVMEDNFCFNLKMEDYAKLSYRSLSSFKRDFVQTYNTSPGKWLMEKRLTYAKSMLTKAGKSVSDVAFECGFESNAHFSRAFSKRFGSPPSAVKRHQQY